MDIKETAESLIAEGKVALDADGDGKVEASEVIDALAGRAKETVEAASVAVAEVKAGLDADGDGAVSGDEVRAVAEGLGKKAQEAAGDLVDRISGKE